MKSQNWSRIEPAQRRTAFYLSLSFLIPYLCMTTTFIVQGVHPFGSHMILTVDLYHQYAPFVAELRNKLLSGDSLWYSWNIGLGTNFWAIFANYAASPLNFILLVFPQKFLSDGIALVVCIRAGLTGLFFALMLRDMDNRREDLFLSCFAGFYALCGWTLAYFWNIMWSDAVMLLPLIVLGLRYLMRDRKPLLYCISLFLCVWSNYYASYFVCLFLIIYSPVCYMTVFQKASLKSAWSAGWRFAVYSLLGGGLSAVLVYPTWTALQQSSATGDSFPKDFSLTQNLFDFMGRFFVASEPNIRDGMANVYCGVMILMLIPLYFLCTKIRLREKIGYGALLVIMYFSFASKILNFIWHGFHFPNQIPFREAFLMSFILVIMAYKVLRNLKTFTINEITVSAAAVLAYLVLFEKFGEGKDWILAIILTAVFVVAYGVVFRVIFLQKKNYQTQKRLLAGVIILELLVATQVTVGLVSMNESFTGWDFYGKKSNEVTAFIESKEQSGEDGTFIRAEMYPAFISNETALYHVKGMSVFSSTADESFITFMKSLGFHNNGINGVRNFGLTKVTAALLGINYLIDVNGDADVPTGFDQVTDSGDLTIARNPDALSVGYMVSSNVLNFVTVNNNNPFKTTNSYLQSLGVMGDVYTPEVLSEKELTNAAFSSGSEDRGYVYSITADKVKTVITFQPAASVAGSHLYLYVQSTEAPSVTVSGTNPDTAELVTSQQEARTGQIIDIGTYDPTMNQKVQLSWDSASSGQVTVMCYSINDSAYQGMLSTLGQSELTVTSYDSTHLNGTVDSVSGGVLLLTVPFDNGWTATVDGASAPILSIGDALMGIQMTGGTHEISMSYTPEGLGLGLKISIASLILIILLTVIPFAFEIRRRIRKGSEILAQNDETLPEAAVSADGQNAPGDYTDGQIQNAPAVTSDGQNQPFSGAAAANEQPVTAKPHADVEIWSASYSGEPDESASEDKRV